MMPLVVIKLLSLPRSFIETQHYVYASLFVTRLGIVRSVRLTVQLAAMCQRSVHSILSVYTKVYWRLLSEFTSNT